MNNTNEFHEIPKSQLKRFKLFKKENFHSIDSKHLSINSNEYKTFSLDLKVADFKDKELSRDFYTLNNIIEKYWNKSGTEDKIKSEFTNFRKSFKGEGKIWDVTKLNVKNELKALWEKLSNQTDNNPIPHLIKDDEWSIFKYTSTSFQVVWSYFPEFHEEMWSEVSNNIKIPWILEWLDLTLVGYKDMELNVESKLANNYNSKENDYILLKLDYKNQPMFKNFYNQVMPELVDIDIIHLFPLGYCIFQLNPNTTFIMVESNKTSMGDRLINKYKELSDEEIETLTIRVFLDSFRKTNQMAFASDLDVITIFRQNIKSLSKPESICKDKKDYFSRIGNWGTSPRMRDKEVEHCINKLTNIRSHLDEEAYNIAYNILFNRHHMNVVNKEERDRTLYLLEDFISNKISEKQLHNKLSDVLEDRMWVNDIFNCKI